MTLGPAAISARGVTLRFGDRPALHGVDFEARGGELVALTGPNGSGKTSLLRCVLGLAVPSEGAVEVDGQATLALTPRERARHVAWVPQEEAPRDDVPIGTYVLYGRYARQPPFGGDSDEDRAIARHALAAVGLADRAQDGLAALSGGERQRLLLARALAQEAPILLLDEPTAHLDIAYELDLLDRVRRLVRERRVCAVAALHDLNLAARFADRVVVLSRGRRVADGPPRDVLRPALLREVWGIDAELRRDPRSGQPYLVPRRVDPGAVAAGGGLRWGPVHVVGGGGAARPILEALSGESYLLTAGVLPLLDSDSEACEALGIAYAAEIPFAPISEEVRAQNRRLLDDARAVVVAPFAVGPTNLANLEDLGGRALRTPVFLVGTGPAEARDFAGGHAAERIRSLLAEGAREVAGVPELLAALSEARHRTGVTSTGGAAVPEN